MGRNGGIYWSPGSKPHTFCIPIRQPGSHVLYNATATLERMLLEARGVKNLCVKRGCASWRSKFPDSTFPVEPTPRSTKLREAADRRWWLLQAPCASPMEDPDFLPRRQNTGAARHLRLIRYLWAIFHGFVGKVHLGSFKSVKRRDAAYSTIFNVNSCSQKLEAGA